MFKTIKYHYKCNDIEQRILLYNSVLYILRKEYFNYT